MASAKASPDAACWICLDHEPDADCKPIVRNCACRGDDAGFAHVSCLADFARSSCAANELKRGGRVDVYEILDAWRDCPTCKTSYCGDVGMSLAKLLLGDVQDLPEQSMKFISALWVMGDASCLDISPSLAVKNYKRIVDILKEDWSTSSIGQECVNHPKALLVSAMDSLATTTMLDFARNGKASGTKPEGPLRYKRECLALSTDIYGESHPETERIKSELRNFECSAGVHRNPEEAGIAFQVKLTEERYARHLRVSGADSEETLTSKAMLGMHYCAAGNTAEGTKLLEEAFETSRRVFGPAHRATQYARQFSCWSAQYLDGPKTAIVIGLPNKPAINGKDVEIIKETKDGKYIVAVTISGKPTKFKALPCNLALSTGTIVRIDDSQRGTIESFDDETGVYTAITENGSVVEIQGKRCQVIFKSN